MKLMVVGPCLSGNEAVDCRGSEILFSLLLEDLRTLNVDHIVIDSAKANHSGKVATWLSVLWRVFSQIKGVSHISVHASRSYMYLLPPIILLNSFGGRHISLRVFGGDFKDHLCGAPSLSRFLTHWIGRRVSDLFLETRRNVEVTRAKGFRAHWLPNSRRLAESSRSFSTYRKRFAFISQVRVDKGVQVLLDVSNQLDDSYTIDIYGPQIDQFIFENYNANYRGTLNHDEVYSTIASYDVIILPTFYADEGYPGVVIEAYAMGKPVIATRWRDLPEIIDDGVTGKLVSPRDAKSLLNAILELDDVNHRHLAAGAAARFTEQFHSLEQTRVFLKTISSR
jgi:glycosyltransferase involved in cell wall biosynthesis